MDETFYTALGVEVDADEETIKSAYRTHVKNTHPDVSDDPGATEEFKRLTTARDVLLDSTERKRYDRLGHNTYVREHVTDSAWSVTDTPADRGRSARAGASETSTTQTTTGGQSTTHHDTAGTWYTNVTQNRTGTRTGAASKQKRATKSRQTSRADGGYGSADWQTASDTYRRTDMSVDAENDSSFETAIDVAYALGPWVFVHLSLLLSAVATGGFFYATSIHGHLSPAALVGATMLVVLVMALSTLHILLRTYS